MALALVLEIRFQDGRFHGQLPDGRPEWPPSPARLFQALVAAAAGGAVIDLEDQMALNWLEGLDERPIIAAPPKRKGQFFSHYLLNNDADKIGGCRHRMSKIRTATKWFRPRIFDQTTPFLFVWHFAQDSRHARNICRISTRLYQLGRGVDMAWAVAEILAAEEAEARLASYPGVVYRPCKSGEGVRLACPQPGSLASLADRFRETQSRFQIVTEPAPTKKDPSKVKVVAQTFSQPPKPRFRQVAYDSPTRHLLFELRENGPAGGLYAWPFSEVVRLVETARDGAADKLKESMADKRALIERVFIGRNATEADKAQRIRILPLPSIGHAHVERAIRRLLVEVPPDCPLDFGDVAWAFAAWIPRDRDGEVQAWQLVEIGEDAGDRYSRMPGHYGMGGRSTFRLWRTVTPAVLPEDVSRRRIDPARITEEAKGAGERLAEEAGAAAAVRQALRHAGIETPVEGIRVQREPFHAKGARVEAFAPGSRFSAHRLWHVEIAFASPRPGPVVIGDGRYLGLGLMAPETAARHNVVEFRLPQDAGIRVTDAPDLLRAVRRALMALSRNDKREVPRLFSGHEPNGAPAGSGSHDHVFLAADDMDGSGRIGRLIVAAPWACDGSVRGTASLRDEFERVVLSLGTVRAGRLGVLKLHSAGTFGPGDPLMGPARVWQSRTPCRPARHVPRGRDPHDTIRQTLVEECLRRKLPRPDVDILSMTSGRNGGNLEVEARLAFAVAVHGPLLLGRECHRGGGLFVVAE